MPITASEVMDKIVSIHTDVEMASTAAVLTGLDELRSMFMQFCEEVSSEVTTVSSHLSTILEEIRG